MTELNKIIQGDCLQVLKTAPGNSINLIITSPPYGNARKNAYGGIHPDIYVEWFRPIAKELHRVLADNGSFVLNIGDNTIDGETHLYTFELPIMFKRELGFKFIDPFIWHKKTTPPGKFYNRFKGAWEFCFHFTKSFDIKFNPQAVAAPAKDSAIKRYLSHKPHHVNKTRNGSGFTNPSKNARRNRANGSGFGAKDERLNMLEYSLPSNVLHFAPETKNIGHPAPFPGALPEFFIKAFTDKGDTVLDPFMGAGTTALVARKLNRNYIGVDLNPEYIKLAEKRLEKELGLLI